jgi:hypothetical protein
MISLDERLASVLKMHDLHCGALVEESGAIAIRVGDFESYGDEGLVSALLGPYGDPAATFGMIQEPILPRIVGQGQYFAFVDRVGGFAAVVFGRTDGRSDVTTLFLLSRAVQRTLIAAFGP